jgi:glutathione-specific gamma-glutamylcyclotransferase
MPYLFAYGSLIWRPNFNYKQKYPAYLAGWERRLCIYSHVYRGTPTNPGLVLGLVQGAQGCMGMVYDIDENDWPSVQQQVWARELVTGVYIPMEQPLWVIREDRCTLETAWIFVADEAHPQFCHQTDPGYLSRLVYQATGQNGSCIEYVQSTFDSLLACGIEDPLLKKLLIVKAAKN